MFQIVASKENADISAVLALIDVSGTMGAIVGLIIIILLPVLVFCGLGWEVLTKKKKLNIETKFAYIKDCCTRSLKNLKNRKQSKLSQSL